jgi:hypothetical protein
MITMQTEDCGTRCVDRVCEQRLPPCVRDILDAARDGRPDAELTCISFHTRTDGRDIARMGVKPELIDDGRGSRAWPRVDARDLLVFSIAVTETTFESVQTVTHVLVSRMRSRS